MEHILRRLCAHRCAFKLDQNFGFLFLNLLLALCGILLDLAIGDEICRAIEPLSERASGFDCRFVYLFCVHEILLKKRLNFLWIFCSRSEEVTERWQVEELEKAA